MEKIIHVKIKTEGNLDDLQKAIDTVAKKHGCSYCTFKIATKYKN